ncbi:MAG: acetylornithine transaminase [Deltaproteobacteria bacterium]|nr:acetylornithine transaminase [Deltaproteobacteria bacterium]
MNLQEIIDATSRYIIPTYGRLPVAFERGEGCRLWDTEGKEYLDLLSGIAVMGAGHSHPVIVAAIREQAGRLMHVSNLYHNELQARLARELHRLSGGMRAFFCNSGTEANEGAIKLARRWGNERRGGRYEILAARGSFHGRTFGALTATGQDRFHRGFAPLLPGIRWVEYDDLPALRAAVSEQTCAVLLEPIQGEGGVRVPAAGYLRGVRELCDELGLLLLLDEVQTGMGRTGKTFAFEHEGIRPDIVSLAKTLGAGFPIGATLAREELATAFPPGWHASTFGGNFLACAASLAYVGLLEGGLTENAARSGAYLKGELERLAREQPLIKDVRGQGLLLGVELSQPLAAKVEEACRGATPVGLILNALGDRVLRLEPPLVIGPAELDQAVAILGRVLARVAA